LNALETTRDGQKLVLEVAVRHTRNRTKGRRDYKLTTYLATFG
jgi:hypothetical protein